MSDPALDTSQPFTRAQAVQAGITDRTLHGTAYRQIFTGIYVAATTTVTPLIRVRAALVRYPLAHASHASAARLLGLPIPTIDAEHVTVTHRRHRRSAAGITMHCTRASETVRRHGVPVSSPRQTFVELATHLTLVDLVVVGDHLVRTRGVVLADLIAFCGRSHLPGAGRAVRAAGYVRERVDSPMETRLRMLVVLAGLPAPAVNWSVRDDDGTPLRRYDLSWSISRTALEYDGRQHVEVTRQWESDVERRGHIEDDGWRLITVIAGGIFGDPAATLTRVHQALRERGEPGVRLSLSDEWRARFPARGG